jgi:zinc transport system substrate-binding protein
MVFHPAWGYFARDYGLIQLSIEIEGKSPKPRQIALIINEARKENIKAILTAPEFSTKVSNSIANELNIRVIKITPLNPNWSQNLINLAKTIRNK